MNADSPNASSFVRATSMPTAAAARSLERTAMNIRPAGALRSRATNRPMRHTMTSTKIANTSELPLLVTPRLSPSRWGTGTVRPV